MHSEMMETTKAILSELAAADSGEVHGLPIARDLYPEESLAAAIETFAAYCEAKVDPSFLSIRVRTEHRRRSREIIGSFLSFLLDHATRLRLRSEVGL
jgi:hypothetical protein